MTQFLSAIIGAMLMYQLDRFCIRWAVKKGFVKVELDNEAMQKWKDEDGGL